MDKHVRSELQLKANSVDAERPTVLRLGGNVLRRWSCTWPSTPAVTMWVPLPSTAMQVSGPCTTSRPHALDAAAQAAVATQLQPPTRRCKTRSLLCGRPDRGGCWVGGARGGTAGARPACSGWASTWWRCRWHAPGGARRWTDSAPARCRGPGACGAAPPERPCLCPAPPAARPAPRPTTAAASLTPSRTMLMQTYPACRKRDQNPSDSHCGRLPLL